MMEKRNVPRLRFPGFEREWEKRRLGGVGSIVNGLTYSPDDIDEDGVLVLRSSNVKDGALRFEDNVYVRSTTFNPVEKNDILICVRNGSRQLIGKNALITSEAEGLAFGAFMSVFRSRSNQFIFQLFSTSKYYKTINENLGATINSINNSDLVKFEFFFPDDTEQNKIADYFSSIDNKTKQLKKKKALLEKYKKGMMQKIFNQEIRFKDEDGKHFGEWSSRTLGEITIKTDRKNKNAKKYPVYSINNKDGFVPQGEQFEGIDSNDRGYDISLYKIIEKNTFAYNPARIDVGSIGYSKDLHNIIISSLYVCFQTVDEVNDDYLYHIFRTEAFRISVVKFLEGGVRNYLFYDSFSKISISLPTIQEQRKIANFLSAIDDKINLVAVEIEKMEKFKKGLLGEMFV